MISADIEVQGRTGGCPGCAALASHGRAARPHNNVCQERIRKIIERTWTGKARMSAYKDRVFETERIKERTRARVERGVGDVLVEPGSEEQMADRHAVASGEDEKQHDENRMKGIHIGKSGSETANAEQPHMLRNTVRFEQEAPDTSSSSTMHVLPKYPASGGKQDRSEPVLVQNSGHVNDDIQISALDVFCEMDGRESRCIKEVLDWYRDEDAGDLSRSELNELVESTTSLNALEAKSEKSEKNEKSNQNIAMNEKIVKSSVMDAKIDPKVVMDLSIFKIGGWNT